MSTGNNNTSNNEKNKTPKHQNPTGVFGEVGEKIGGFFLTLFNAQKKSPEVQRQQSEPYPETDASEDIPPNARKEAHDIVKLNEEPLGDKVEKLDIPDSNKNKP